jgi:tRNA threonylcarbamoyladenosine dehydratase
MAVDERFSRTERLLGSEALAKLKPARVMVVGLGAVGSFAVEALARSGVGRLHLVDFDVVRTTNINRQLLAMDSTLGRPKVELAAGRVRDINPACEVRTSPVFVHAQTLPDLLAEPPDVIMDAIDSLAPKVELLAHAIERKIPVVSSMGAARRVDVLSLRAGLLSEVTHDGLAAKIRKRLRQRGLGVDVRCVYSVEPPRELSDDGEVAEGEAFDRGRTRRPMGSLPTVTGSMGLLAASEILRMLLKQ